MLPTAPLKYYMYMYIAETILYGFSNLGVLRIDNRRQSAFCGILPSLLAITCTLTHNISNERLFFSPSDYILNNMISFLDKKI